MTEQTNQPATTTAAKDQPAGRKAKPPRTPSPGRLWRRIAAALVIVVVLGAVWISWPAWAPGLPGWLRGPLTPVMEAGRATDLTTRVAAVERKLAGLTADVATLRTEIAQRPAAAPSNGQADRLRALDKRLDGIDQSLTGLRTRIAHVEPLESRMTALDSAIKALAAKPPPSATGSAPPPDNAANAANAAVARLRSDTGAKLAALRQQNQNLAAGLADAGKRIAAIEARIGAAGNAAHDSAFVLAVGQLRDAVRSGRPFTGALSGLRAIAGGDREVAGAIAVLQPFAGSGVADLATLRARFALVAPRIAGATPHAGKGWLDQALARLSNLVRIRHTGAAAAAGTGPEAAAARAELALDAGDIAGAVQALGKLTGAAADAAAPWLAGARARLAADSAVATLDAEAIGRLGNTGASGASGG